MIFVYFYKFLPYYQKVLLDAAVMVTMISPLLYLLSTGPLLQPIQQRAQKAQILQVRLTILQCAITHALEELLCLTLDQIEELTGSKIGFFQFLESDQKTLWLRTWSTHTLQNMCTVSGTESPYEVDQAGVWIDCIRARRPVIHNDYASLPHRRRLPEEYAPVIRELAVPIMREGDIVAIPGVGNKLQNYTANDNEFFEPFWNGSFFHTQRSLQ